MAITVIGVLAPVSAQVTDVSLDLRNTFALYNTTLDAGDINLRTYGQYYVLTLSGIGIDPRLMQFHLQTSLSKFSSTRRFIENEQSLNSANFGFYNASISILPDHQAPLTLYASRSQELLDQSIVDPLSTAGLRGSRDIERTGLRWAIAKNTYLPQIEINVERNLMTNNNVSFHSSERNDVLSCRFSNANTEGSSEYSLQYGGTKKRDDLFQIDRTDHEFQFHSKAKLIDEGDVFLNATYLLQDYTTSRNVDMTMLYRQSESVRHELKLQNRENSVAGSVPMKSATTVAAYQASLGFSDRVQGTFGAEYLYGNTHAGNDRTFIDRGALQSQIYFNYQLSSVGVNGSVGSTVGFETYPITGRRFVQQTQLDVGGSSATIVPRIQLSLRDALSFANSYTAGKTMQNTVRLSAATDVIPRWLIGIEASRHDSRYFESEVIDPRTIHSLGGNTTTRLTPTTLLEGRHMEQWMRSWYVERMSTSMVSITESGIFPNFSAQVRVERGYNSATKINVVNMESIFYYRLYAFTFSATYSYRVVGTMRSQGVMFEIRRPVALSFRD